MRKPMVFLLTPILLMQVLALGASAVHPVPDPDAGGSITVHIQCGGKNLEGGDLYFLQTAEIAENNGDYSYVWTKEFEPAGLDISQLQTARLAEELAQYARKNKIAGHKIPVKNGMVRYEVPKGAMGLYLMIQKQACTGYEKLRPFLIGVPKMENGAYIYHVDASPKMSKPVPKPEDKPDKPDKPDTPDVPDKPSKPDKPVKPSVPDQPRLPQTGQLNWPVPIMALTGLILFAAGWVCRERKTGEKNRAGLVLMIAGLILLVSAAALLLYNQHEEQQAAETSQALFEKLEQNKPETPALSIQPILPEKTEMETVEIDGHTYMGGLHIPELELALPVLADWSYENLSLAPCRYFGSPQTEDLVIMAHNYKGHFGRLADLNQGAQVYLKDVNHNITTYKVADVEILQPDQVEEMNAGEYPLTLFTCTYSGQGRVALRCQES